MNSEQAEITRLLYKYRRLIQKGMLHLSYQSAAKLIGPDCAYHLYSSGQTGDSGKKGTTDIPRALPIPP